MSLPESFWSKTTESDCVIWSGAQNSKGYGCYTINGKSQLAHHVAWIDAHGPIPSAMTIDHRCRVRCCVNVAHMELVSIAENNRRKFKAAGGLQVGMTCRHGHLITTENLYIRPSGSRDCGTCRAERRRRAA